MRECGELVLRSQLESMVEILDQHLFLEGPRVEAERARQRAAFLDAPTRPAFLAGRSYAEAPDASRGGARRILRSPGRTGPDRFAARRPHAWPRGAAHRLQPGRRGVRVGVPRPCRGPRRRLFHRSGNRPRGTRRPQLRGDRQGLRDPVRPARGRPRGPGRGHPSGAGRSLRGRARAPGRALRRVSGGLAPVSPASRGRGRAADRAASRQLRARMPASRPEPRGPTGDRRRAGRRPRRHGRHPAPLLHRGRCGPRHVGPRFGDDWRAGAAELARVQADDRALLTPVSGRTPRRSSPRRSGNGTATGSAACHRSTRSCDSCPEERGDSSTTSSGPTPTARSPSRAWASRRWRRRRDPSPTRDRRRPGSRPRRSSSASTERAHGVTTASRSPTRVSSGTSTRTSVLTERVTTSRRGRCASRSTWTTPRSSSCARRRASAGHHRDPSERREPGDARRRHARPGSARRPVLPGQGRGIPGPALRRGLAPARRADRG